MQEIVGVKFKKLGKVYFFNPNGLVLEKGQNVIVAINNCEIDSVKELEGCIIRVTDNEGQFIVGCRMFEEREDIMKYVNTHYAE